MFVYYTLHVYIYLVVGYIMELVIRGGSWRLDISYNRFCIWYNTYYIP